LAYRENHDEAVALEAIEIKQTEPCFQSFSDSQALGSSHTLVKLQKQFPREVWPRIFWNLLI
jgi:hypothetical protein